MVEYTHKEVAIEEISRRYGVESGRISHGQEVSAQGVRPHRANLAGYQIPLMWILSLPKRDCTCCPSGADSVPLMRCDAIADRGT